MLGHLEGGPLAVNYLFSKCVDVGPEKFLKDRLKGNPTSCPTIRKKIPHVTRRLPCNCPFDYAPDRYPTPVLHLLTLKETTPASRRRPPRTWKRWPAGMPPSSMPRRGREGIPGAAKGPGGNAPTGPRPHRQRTRRPLPAGGEGGRGRAAVGECLAAKRHKKHKRKKREKGRPRRVRKGKAKKGENMKPANVFALCDLVRETSFALHQYLRHGHLEKVTRMDWPTGCGNRGCGWSSNMGCKSKTRMGRSWASTLPTFGSIGP